MRKIRCLLATIALIVTLGGLSLQGMGAGVLANASTHSYIGSVHASSLAFKPYGPCPGGGAWDC